MKKKLIIKNGLRPLKKDKRDFKHSQVFGSPLLSVPNVDFDIRVISEVKNQEDSDFCAGFSSSSINEDIQKQTFCPYYQFAKIKQVQGEYRSWGADLRSACKAAIKFGSLPTNKSPITSNPKDRNLVANWLNWPKNLDILAGEFKCGSFISAIDENSFDNFDNIRYLLWKNKDKNQGVLFGVAWRPEWTYNPSGIIPEADYKKPSGSGHAIKICGQKIISGVPYLKVQNSWGTSFGDKGFYYFPRSVINIETEVYGAFMLSDMDAETIKTYIAYNLTTQDSIISMIVKIINTIFNDFKKLL